jgi:hypothetical protein
MLKLQVRYILHIYRVQLYLFIFFLKNLVNWNIKHHFSNIWPYFLFFARIKIPNIILVNWTLKKETKKIAHKPNPSNAQYVILIHTPPTLEILAQKRKKHVHIIVTQIQLCDKKWKLRTWVITSYCN